MGTEIHLDSEVNESLARLAARKEQESRDASRKHESLHAQASTCIGPLGQRHKNIPRNRVTRNGGRKA